MKILMIFGIPLLKIDFEICLVSFYIVFSHKMFVVEQVSCWFLAKRKELCLLSVERSSGSENAE